MCTEDTKLNEKINDILNGIENDKLKCLFKCFYCNLENDNETINIALNVFFGNFNENDTVNELNNTYWVDKFKSSIKERYSVTKNGVTKYKLKEPDQHTIENLSEQKIIDMGKSKWDKIKMSLQKYFDSLKYPISKTLIYEAPPYLISIDEQNEKNFEAEFIFDQKCLSPYVNAIKNCFTHNNGKVDVILIDNSVGFFDVIPIPIPINSDLREKWATDKKFIIDNKRIFVHFFEWALEIYLFKLNEKFETEDHKIAIGIPLKNAISIYEHAKNNNDWPGYELDINFCDAHNFNDTYTKPEGLWVQPYKNCIIGSSNTPSGELMKLAFELPA